MTPTPVSELGVVGIHVCWGSRWESKEDNGAAHFLEHLLCKGSTHFSRNETYELFDHLGCSFNAFTNRETMSYFIHFLPRSAERALPVFTDSIILPALASDAHREERLHIRAEIESVANDIRESIFDVAHATAYSCSMGLPVLGPLHNVEKVISPSSLRALHNRVVTPDRMLFSVSASAVGGSMDTAIAWANKFVVPALETKAANAAKGAAQAAPPSSPGIFGRILGAATGGAPAAHIPSTHAVPLPPPGTVPLAQWVGGCAGVAMPLPRTHAVLGFRGYGVTNPKELAVHNVLLSLLGSHDPGIDAGHAVTPLTRALLYGDSDAHAHSGCDVEMIVDPFCFPYGKEALTGLYTSVATRGATGAPQGATSLARVVRTFFDELGRAATAITDDELDVARSKALRDTLLQNECPRLSVAGAVGVTRLAPLSVYCSSLCKLLLWRPRSPRLSSSPSVLHVRPWPPPSHRIVPYCTYAGSLHVEPGRAFVYFCRFHVFMHLPHDPPPSLVRSPSATFPTTAS